MSADKMNMSAPSIHPTSLGLRQLAGILRLQVKNDKLAYWRAFPSINARNAAPLLVFGILILAAHVPAIAADSAATSASRTNKSTDASLPISTVTQPLPGTLFFTPTQRARLDAARKRGVVVIDDEVLSSPAASPVMNGFLHRSDGQNVVWINGVIHRLSDADARGRLNPSMIGDASTVVLKSASDVAAPATTTKVPKLRKQPRHAKPAKPPNPIPAPAPAPASPQLPKRGV